MKTQKQLAEEWIKKHDIVGNKVWWDGRIYYNLSVEQICSIAKYIIDKYKQQQNTKKQTI